jgi:hypothetical protein
MLAWALLMWSGCGVLGPPGGERPRPVSPLAARAPAELATPRESGPAGSADSAASAGGAAPSVRLLRPPPGEAAGGDAATSAAPRQGYAPDPEPLSSRAWWAYDVRYDRGAIEPGSPVPQCLAQPASSVRRMGRFAFELWIGPELVERIRFDFPLLAGEPPRSGSRRPLREEPSFAPGARVSTRILVPASPRATRAQILDRATGQTLPVPWPPASSANATGSGVTGAPCSGSSQGQSSQTQSGGASLPPTPGTPTPPAR